MIIIGIMLALVLPRFTGARKTADKGNAETAALALGQAIGAFQLDHGGRVPAGGTKDWPKLEQGPIDLSGRPYLRGAHITHFTDGTIQLEAGGQTTPLKSGAVARVVYTPLSSGAANTPAVGYRMLVHLAEKGAMSPTPACQITDGSVQGATLPGLRTCR